MYSNSIRYEVVVGSNSMNQSAERRPRAAFFATAKNRPPVHGIAIWPTGSCPESERSEWFRAILIRYGQFLVRIRSPKRA